MIKFNIHLLDGIRHWLETIHVDDRRQANWLCRFIPAQCPFARTIEVFGHPVMHIPPLCKLNPFYEQLTFLRFQALCFLAEQNTESLA